MASETKKTLADVQEYWTKAAKVEVDNDNLRPTARDPHLQSVVEAAIEKWLYDEATLLDVGCGEGISTLRFAQRVKRAVGVDFIEKYVATARAKAADSQITNTIFETGNVLDLSDLRARHAKFNIVTTIRCLINLVSWTNQAKAIAEIAACLRPGGMYLASEGWQEGMEGLNLHRRRVGLETIRVVEYNTMVSRIEFEREASKYFEIVDFIGVGFYLYMSRVFQPLFVQPDPPQHGHRINMIAAQLQTDSLYSNDFGECDYAGVYVLRRRA